MHVKSGNKKWLIEEKVLSSVENNIVALWDTRTVRNGHYKLLLIAVDEVGHQTICTKVVIVYNWTPIGVKISYPRDLALALNGRRAIVKGHKQKVTVDYRTWALEPIVKVELYALPIHSFKAPPLLLSPHGKPFKVVQLSKPRRSGELNFVWNMDVDDDEGHWLFGYNLHRFYAKAYDTKGRVGISKD